MNDPLIGSNWKALYIYMADDKLLWESESHQDIYLIKVLKRSKNDKNVFLRKHLVILYNSARDIIFYFMNFQFAA